MKLFGFDLLGIQTVYVKCPRCGKAAHMTFNPCDESTLPPVNSDLKDALEKAGMLDFITLPKSDDIHIVCMNCMTRAKQCETFNHECKIEIRPSEMGGIDGEQERT